MEWCEARPAFKKARTSQTGFVYTGLAGEDKWKDDQKITGSMKTVRDKYPDGVLVTRKADGLKHYAFYYPNRMESSARTAAPGSERQQTARTTEGQPPTDSQTITTSTAKSDHEAFKKTPMRGPFGGLGREISKGISDPVIQPINWSKNRIAFAVSNTDAIAVREPQRRKLIIDMGEPEMPEEYVSSSSGLPQHQANPLKPPRMTERAWISGPEWVADYDDGARGSGNELGYRQHSIQTSAANLSPARLTLDNLRKHTREALHPLDIAALPRKDGLDTSEQHKGRALRTDGKGSSQEFKSKLDGFVLASRAIDARQRELGIIINDDIPAPIKQPRGKFFSPAPRRRERGSRPRFNPSNHHPRSPAHDGWD